MHFMAVKKSSKRSSLVYNRDFGSESPYMRLFYPPPPPPGDSRARPKRAWA